MRARCTTLQPQLIPLPVTRHPWLPWASFSIWNCFNCLTIKSIVYPTFLSPIPGAYGQKEQAGSLLKTEAALVSPNNLFSKPQTSYSLSRSLGQRFLSPDHPMPLPLNMPQFISLLAPSRTQHSQSGRPERGQKNSLLLILLSAKAQSTAAVLAATSYCRFIRTQ